MSSQPNPLQAPPGLRVGPYELLYRLGEGGMGVVHLARRADGHRVALKVLRPHIVGDDEARARLAREVSSLSRIRSRSVAEIVDADPWGPVAYVATRYVPGLSLHDHVVQEGPVQDLGWFAARLADALAAVHSVGVLHRDVKPSNVLMEGRAPILIDFGLARVADDPRLTHTGWLLGTPGYLAPEILLGRDATTASDIHSWAATVTYAGTGNPPFGRGPSMAVMDRVRRGEHDLSSVPSALRPLLTAALSPEPADRPTLDELHAWLRGEPAPAAPRATVPMTVPLVAAPGLTDEDPFDEPADLPQHTHVDTPARTSMLPVESGEFDPWADDEPDEEHAGRPDPGPEPAPEPVGAGARLRRAVLTLALLGLAAVGFALAPYVAGLVMVLLLWLLRAGSLAGSRHLHRQSVRGRRWYDVVTLPLSYPWFFVVAVPGALVLALWSLGLAVATALVGYAVAAPVAADLAAMGATLAVAGWWGPGGSRLRGPLRRTVAALSARPWVWVVTVALVLGAAALAGVQLRDHGIDWSPAGDGPFARQSFLRSRLGL